LFTGEAVVLGSTRHYVRSSPGRGTLLRPAPDGTLPRRCRTWDWLLALPISSCGLRLTDDAVCVAVALRLGCSVCVADLPATDIFQPLAFETHSTTHSSALDFNAVGGRSAAELGDPREASFLWQHISVLTQRFNAILISETFFCPDEAQTSSYSGHLRF